MFPDKKMADGQELLELLELKIPSARQQLRDSHKNLNDLATYCERNYVDSGQSQASLDETKRYAAQSLASVAYQVNILASNMLDLLDKQMKHMKDMEANIHHISQVRGRDASLHAQYSRLAAGCVYRTVGSGGPARRIYSLRFGVVGQAKPISQGHLYTLGIPGCTTCM